MAVQCIIETLQKRGFIVNFRKECFLWCEVEWLGVILDISLSFIAPVSKMRFHRKDIRVFMKLPLIFRHMLERVIGLLRFASLVDPVGKAVHFQAKSWKRVVKSPNYPSHC